MSRILEWNWSPMALACWIGCASWLYVCKPSEGENADHIMTKTPHEKLAPADNQGTAEPQSCQSTYLNTQCVQKDIPLHSTSPSEPPAPLESSPVWKKRLKVVTVILSILLLQRYTLKIWKTSTWWYLLRLVLPPVCWGWCRAHTAWEKSLCQRTGPPSRSLSVLQTSQSLKTVHLYAHGWAGQRFLKDSSSIW